MKMLRRTFLTSVATAALVGFNGCLVRSGEEGWAAQGPAGVPAPAPLRTAGVTGFQLQNWSGSSSPGFARFVLAFARGQCPRGSVLVVKRGDGVVDAQFDARCTWDDGSLRFAVTSLRDKAFSGSEERAYDVFIESGAFNNTGAKTLADVNGLIQPAVAFSSVTQTGDAGTNLRGSGTFSARFSDHAGVATRVTKIRSGPVLEEWYAWGMAVDSMTGAPDPHLKTEWRVGLWKNADGSVADVEYGCEVCQDWFAEPGKYRLNYTAALYNGPAAKYTYPNVQHPYQTHWATVRTDNDNNEGRRPWLKQIPTLIYKPDFVYWANLVKCIPPFNRSAMVSNNADVGYTARYTPCGNMNHRGDIDSGGSYPGRGIVPNTDAIALMRPSGPNYRHARVNAFAGLHIHFHIRSQQKRKRPGDAAPDIANTVYSLPLKPKPPSEYDFTAKGMPPPSWSRYWNKQDFSPDYVWPEGGTGVWSYGWGDTSHASNFCYAMYLLEGEDWFMRATLGLAMKAVQQQWEGEAVLPPAYSAADTNSSSIRNIAATYSIPNAPYYQGMANLWSSTSRAAGWALMLLGAAAGIVPDDDPQSGPIRLLNKHQGDWFTMSFKYLVGSDLAKSGVYGSLGYSVWMCSFCVQGASFNYNLTRDPGIKMFADHVTHMIAGIVNSGMLMRTDSYIIATTPKGYGVIDWTKDNQNLSPDKFMLVAMRTALTAATGVFVWNRFNDNGDIITARAIECITLANGDQVTPTAYSGADGNKPIPPELKEGEMLYAVNVSGNKFQVSRTAGGAPIRFSSDMPETYLRLLPLVSDRETAITGSNYRGYVPIQDWASGIVRAGIDIAAQAGNEEALKASPIMNKWFAYADGSARDSALWQTWKTRWPAA